MQDLKVGELVRDKLNEGQGSYGLGVVVAITSARCVQDPLTGDYEGVAQSTANRRSIQEPAPLPGKRYDVYFNKFEKTITFHGDYLERV